MIEMRRKSLLDQDGVEIGNPAANRHYAIAPTGAYVNGISGTNVTKVWLKILRLNDPIPTALDATWVAVIPQNQNFTISILMGAVTLAISGSIDNKVVAIPETNTGIKYQKADIVYFVGRPTIDAVPISSKCCIWFSFAPSNLAGPIPGDCEYPTQDYKPFSLIVPANARQISVTTQGTWAHCPQMPVPAPDAEGTQPPVGLQYPGYRSATYLSDQIPLFTTLVNKLIGMWTDASDVPISVFDIGRTLNGFAINPSLNIHRLYLAHHDGQRWHNDIGSITASITWVL